MSKEKFILELVDLLRRHELIGNENPTGLTLKVGEWGTTLTTEY